MVPILQVKGVSKIYSNGIYANKNVNFSVFPGEIHALMGENGAGKSTLMKILFGMEKPDGGEIYVEGQRVEISSPHRGAAPGHWNGTSTFHARALADRGGKYDFVP